MRLLSGSLRKDAPSLSTVVFAAMMVLGLGIIAYPTVSDWWNSYHQSQTIAGYTKAVEAADPEALDAMLVEAEEYNRLLLADPNRYSMTDEERAAYEAVLDITGTGVMGYVQIPKVGISYPIYHGMQERVLQEAIGHIEGTSLPVGGSSTHAVISGHRGLPRARLFTDIDQLVEGDRFIVTVLGRVLTYQVDQIRIVKPNDMRELGIVEGEDYMTLVTCTPYGVNSHRMLVRGHRLEESEEEPVILAEAVWIPSHIAILAMAIPLLFVLLALQNTLAFARQRTLMRQEGEAHA